MKKFGFTLAEILIALAIVGIVAAITLPTLTTSTKKETNMAKAKVTVSDLENAFSLMIASEGVQDLEEAKICDGGNLYNELSKYVKVSTADSAIESGTGFKMKNGAIVSIKIKSTTSTTEVADINIDVNGTDNPNKDGLDQFDYVLDAYGMLTEN